MKLVLGSLLCVILSTYSKYPMVKQVQLQDSSEPNVAIRIENANKLREFLTRRHMDMILKDTFSYGTPLG